MSPRTSLLVLLAMTSTACGGGAAVPPTSSSTTRGSASAAVAPTPSPPGSSCATPGQSPPTSTIAAAFATALAFAPDGRLFFAERSGTVRVWQGGRSRVFARVPTVTTESGGGYSERGLLGLAVSPTFASDRFVFAFYSDTDRGHQHVIRWTDCGGTGTTPTTIITLPSGGDCCHKGGRIAFGPDARLYVTVGDEHSAAAAQDTSDVRGKVLRYNPDGSIPADNPFGAGDPVWAYGLRNPFGIAFTPGGQMAVTNNGPSGDAGSPATGYDTVMLSVQRGGGYQWPNCYGYEHPLQSSSCGAGEHGPDWSSEARTVVPTGTTFVDSSGPAPFAGHVVMCTYTGGMLVFTTGGSAHASVTSGPPACTLDVVQGPDHALYYSDTRTIYRTG